MFDELFSIPEFSYFVFNGEFYVELFVSLLPLTFPFLMLLKNVLSYFPLGFAL
jgi:hypothetical protein